MQNQTGCSNHRRQCNRALPVVVVLASVGAAVGAWAYEPPASRAEIVRMMPQDLWSREPVAWVDDVVVVLQPYCYDETEKERLVREFSPDLLDWYCGPGMNSGRFMWMRGVRCSYCEEYEYQEALQFSNADAERLFMDNGITRKLDGKPARFGAGRYHNAYFMCHNAPKWHEVVVQGLTRVAAFGDSVTQDNIGVPLNKGNGNFCDWCNRRFLEWLRRRYAASTVAKWLGRAGVKDTAEFHIRAHINALRQKGLPNDRIIWDPLVHEYIRFQYMSHIAAWVDAATATKREAAAQGLPIPALYGNQWGAWGHLPYATALSQYVDVVWIEGGCTQPPFTGSQHALAPLFYKVGRAAGDFHKPVWTIEYPEHDYPNSKMATAAALSDAFASGGFLVGLWAMRHLDGPRYEINRLYWNFADENRALFVHREQLANVALVYSLPTWMWRRFSALSCGVPQGDYALFARVLEDAHIPFECIVFGHPDIFDDSRQLSRLPRYQAVVVMGADCMSRRQADALYRYARGGGTVVIIPPFYDRSEDGYELVDRSRPPAFTQPSDEELARRRVVERAYGKGSVVWISPQLMRDWKAGGERKKKAFADYQAVLRKAMGEKIWLETDAPAIVWTEPWLCGSGRLVAVHLVNYAIDLKADTVRDPGRFRLSLRLPKGVEADEARLLEPGRKPRALRIERIGQRAVVTVPGVSQYAIVAVGGRGALAAANQYQRVRKVVRRLEVALRCRDILRAEAAPQEPPAPEAPRICERLWRRAEPVQRAIRSGDFAAARRLADALLAEDQRLLERAVSENLRLNDEILAGHVSVEADLKFDFGTGPVAEGWQRIDGSARWAKGKKFGWDDPAAVTFTGGTGPTALHGDVARGSGPATFHIALPDGLYECALIVPCTRTFTTEVRRGAEVLLPAAAGHPGTYALRRFTVEVHGGDLALTFGGGPTGPLFRTSDAWAVCGVAVKRVAAGEAVRRNESLRAHVHQWLLVGYDEIAGCGRLAQLAERYRPPQHKFAPPLVVPGCRGVPEVDVAAALHSIGDKVARLRFSVRLGKARRVRVHFGATGRALVWLLAGGRPRLIVCDWKANGLSPDEYVVPLDLPAGLSTFEVATSCCFGDDWRVAAAVTDERGRPVGDIVAAPPGTKTKRAAMLPRVDIALPGQIELGQPVDGRLVFTAPGVATAPAAVSLSVLPDGCPVAAVAGESKVPALPPDGRAEIPLRVVLERTAEAALAEIAAELVGLGERAGLRARRVVRLVQPALELRISTDERPRRVMSDFAQGAAPWRMNSKGVAAKASLDRRVYKSPPAAVRIDMRDNANGREDYPYFGVEFSPPEDWLAYERLEFWARCESELPERTKRHLCVEIVDRWYANHDIHFYVPDGQWQKLSVDLRKIPRGAIRALRFFVYEMDSKGAEYTWWFDDVALINDDPRRLADNEALVRVLLKNPLSTTVSGVLNLRLANGWTTAEAGPRMLQAEPHSSALAEYVVKWPAGAAGRVATIRVDLETKWGPIAAETSFQPLPRITAPRTNQAPRIDGRLDDRCWKSAAWVSGFVRNTDCAPASVPTRAAVCWDDANLYIAFLCREPYTSALVTKHRERDSEVWMDDCIEVYIDADADRQPGDYDHYVVNSAGVLRDERGGDGRWNSHARAAASVGDGEWYVELAIPWRDYGGGPPARPWAINLHRTRQPKPKLPQPEYQCWSCTRGPFDNPRAFGTLRWSWER